MLTKEVKEKYKNATRDELLDATRKGTLEIQREDREEFFKFVAKTPEERNAEIQGGAATIPDVPATDVPSKDVQGGQAAEIPAQVAGGSPSTDPWAEFGYKSPNEIVEAHKSLINQVQKLSATIDGLNAKGGKQGQELKRLKEEREDLLKKLNVSSPQELSKPQKPVRPRPDQFEDGILDEKYQNALAKYQDDFEQFTENLVEFNAKRNKEEVAAVVETRIKDVAPQAVDDDGYGDLFNNAIPKFQEKFNLVTSVSVKAISDAHHALKSSDPAVVARANDFLNKTVPPADMKKYELIVEAVGIAYDFTNEKAIPKYRTIEGALYDNGKLGENSPYKPVIKPAALTPEEEKAAIERRQQQNGGTVSAIPSSQASVGDAPISAAMTRDEKLKRYKDLLTDYNKAMNSGDRGKAFEKTEQFQEWLKLRKELYDSTPQWR